MYGFYPDIKPTQEQKQNKEINVFLRQLQSAVTQSNLEGIVEYYDKGGMEWQDSTGVVWNLVPVIAFMATDMKEARAQKGTYQAWKCRMPCNMCTLSFEEIDSTPEPKDLQYRKQEDVKRALDDLAVAEM